MDDKIKVIATVLVENLSNSISNTKKNKVLAIVIVIATWEIEVLVIVIVLDKM